MEHLASTQRATQKANLDSFARKMLQISCETFHRKIYFLKFRVFVYSVLSRIVLVKIFPF